MRYLGDELYSWDLAPHHASDSRVRWLARAYDGLRKPAEAAALRKSHAWWQGDDARALATIDEALLAGDGTSALSDMLYAGGQERWGFELVRLVK
ncbi:MAG: hypothetical protein WCI05_09080 [Myxococcales bacterium]